ncbi:hypothetical protein ABZT03_21295 [Streptomyces sp. NPDC005574]|uniref:hypothetical protein n=1 Tax=Streptomyces sp. NPDC005574 TaxID=3156891 RepID=UPI0033B04093
MPNTAEQLLSALEPLSFPARLALTAKVAHRLANEGQLAQLPHDLDARGPYEQRLAALAASAGRHAEYLTERLADPDPVVAGYALRAARVLPVPDRAVEAACDDAPAARRKRLARLLVSGDGLGSRTHWRHAAYVLHDLAASEVPHPVGGAVPGSAFHDAVAELLDAMHRPEGECEVLEGRDLPALQRLRTLLLSLDAAEGRGREVAGAVAAQLAPEPLLLAERATLLAQLAAHTTEPAALLERLRYLAQTLEGAGVGVGVQVARRLTTGLSRPAEPQHTDALLTAAGELARADGTAAGLLATGLVTGTGPSIGRPEERRSLLRLLRRHPDPDVRHRAYQQKTHAE